MQKPPYFSPPLFRQLIWHCLMGITLGILCGGLLLQIGSSHPGALLHNGNNFVERLRFLLILAFFFGIAATLTGAAFLATDEERSESK